MKRRIVKRGDAPALYTTEGEEANLAGTEAGPTVGQG